MSTSIKMELGTQRQTRYRAADEPHMRILILGDFSGRANRGLLEHDAGIAERPVVPVDVDDIHELMFRMAPRLHLPSGDPSGGGMVVELKNIEDFHPDSLFGAHELFRTLKQQRARLLDPATYPEAASELKRWAADRPVPTEPPEEPTALAPQEDDAATLERLLGKPPTQRIPAGPPPETRPDFSRVIRAIVAPYLVPGRDPQQAQLVAALDAGIAERMRAMLHAPAFQALESAWRSLDGLVRSLETGERLQIFVLDLSKDELAADLMGASVDASGSGLHTLLVERGVRTPGGEPWSVIVGNYRFGSTAEDVALLERLGALASQAGGPLLAEADLQLLGCGSVAELAEPQQWKPAGGEEAQRWQALRRSRVARFLGLAMPRLLLRLPYGAKKDVVERFAFEELSPSPDHEAFLWGNPAFGCAKLLGESFTANEGWMQVGDRLVLEDLPAHVVEDAGGARLMPPAEVFLTERAVEAVLARGLMPMLSYRDRNIVRLARFQSLADPPAGLSGPWS